MSERIVYCPDHSSTQMKKQDGYYALTGLNKNSTNSITFLPSSGIPIVVYYCAICGKVEIFVAQSEPGWNNSK